MIPRVVYFRQGNREPVLEFIKDLVEADQDLAAKVVGHIRVFVAEGPLSPVMVCRHLGDGLWELKIASVRVFYCVERSILWLLHAIVKKSAKAPQKDMDLARKRMKEVRKS